ncbi:MAG: N-acetylmuramoyl-L-alanine amidase [Myxococcota bacterium]|nr:N-acetylmuramoyl-L-alanine amidase [Myxococcota bacterium]
MRLIAVVLATSPLTALSQPLIMLDPGHGGGDPGAVGCNQRESIRVLDIALRTGPLLESARLRVEFTRTDDTPIGVSARAAYANERMAELFVSIHANANDGAPASGTETWIAQQASQTSVRLAESVQRAMVAAWNLPDRGIRRRNFTVVANTAMPAILTEVGFINRCDADARLIADPDQRQVIARAHAIGITETLDAGPIAEMPMATGELKGVVFEDLGIGVDNPSVRLPGAAVTILETGQTKMAEPETANWAFILPAGRYTVNAEFDGYDLGERRCDVLANAETWCSVGLVKRAASPSSPPSNAPLPMAGQADEAIPSAMTAGQTETPNSEYLAEQSPVGGVKPPIVQPMQPPSAGRPPGIDDFTTQSTPRVQPSLAGATPPTLGTSTGRQQFVGSCSTGPANTVPGIPFILLLVALAYRRRAWLVIAGSLLVGTANAHIPETRPGGIVAAIGDDSASQARVSLEQTRIIAHGYERAILSPDGHRVILVHPGQNRLSVLKLVSGAHPRMVASGRGIGRNPRWYPNGQGIAFTSAEQSSDAQPMLGVSLTGVPETPPLFARTENIQLRDHRVYVNDKVISPHHDRFFFLRVAPNATHMVFWGLKTGLWLYRRTDRQLWSLGAGGHPAFDLGGNTLVFDQTVERGGAIVGADLFLVDLSDDEPSTVPLTRTADRMEFKPNRVGRRVVFTDDVGTIWLGMLVDSKD